jgi:DNA-dependent protein kinase catalytic subunit
MSSNLGLIEWVSETKPLKDCVEERMPNRLVRGRMHSKYSEWINKHRSTIKERHSGEYNMH